MSVDVSVIMPLYNAKDYVELTVDSILNQTLKNLEIVIVDDCSTDGSLDFCRELYGQDARVRTLQQPQNMGPGAARNTGIREAHGEYVVFVDSDDEILPDTLAKMFETAKKYDADIVHTPNFMYPIPGEDGKIPLQLISDDVELFPLSGETVRYNEVTLVNDDLTSRLNRWTAHQINWSVCNKMFRRKFLTDNDIHFSGMKLAEDMVFCFEGLFKAKTFVILPGGGYVYRIVATSLSRGKKSSAHIIKALRSQLIGAREMSRVLTTIPFFASNPDKARIALERVLDELEISYVRTAYQELGYEALRSDQILSEFFREEFGEKAPYVEFLFHELHKRYEPVIDYFAKLGDMETWRAIAKDLREKEKNNQ